MSKMKSTTCYLHRWQVDALRKLSEQTKVPIAEYIRQGVDLVLKRKAPDDGQTG